MLSGYISLRANIAYAIGTAGENSMKEIITSISNTFIEEAKASPRMLEDLAAMEKYLSESICTR